jgi:hypothetical protein
MTIAATTCSWLNLLRLRHQGVVLAGAVVVTDAIRRSFGALR